MFKLVYRVRDDEAAEKPEGFDGVELSASSPAVEGLFGRRMNDAKSAATLVDPAAYVVFPAFRNGDARIFQSAGHTLMMEPTQQIRTARDLWQALEWIGRPDMRLAWSADWGHAIGERASVVVPLLNLRLGSVRVQDDSPETFDYARRLAGIGFGGYFVIDPAPAADRRERAVAIAAAVRLLIDPPKPAARVLPKPTPKAPAATTI